MFGLHRNHLPPTKRSTVSRDMARYPGPTLNRAQEGSRSVRQMADPDALKKITVLESELLKLRAQIAMIVTAAPASGLNSLYLVLSIEFLYIQFFLEVTFLCSFDILSGLIESQNELGMLLTFPPPPPALTSTPHCPPPPPPPLPPPPCPSSSAETTSVLELIHRRRKNEKEPKKGQPKPQVSVLNKGSEIKGIPSMLDVLKDLNQVKLRSVER